MRCAFGGIIYTSATCSCLWLLLLMQMLLLPLQQGEAMPWWRRQHNNDASYDASLDPLVWSRAFVQDTVRRPRISQLEAAEVPQLGKHRRRWWESNNHNNKKKSYKQYVRRHRKRLLLHQTRC